MAAAREKARKKKEEDILFEVELLQQGKGWYFIINISFYIRLLVFKIALAYCNKNSYYGIFLSFISMYIFINNFSHGSIYIIYFLS